MGKFFILLILAISLIEIHGRILPFRCVGLGRLREKREALSDHKAQERGGSGCMGRLREKRETLSEDNEALHRGVFGFGRMREKREALSEDNKALQRLGRIIKKIALSEYN